MTNDMTSEPIEEDLNPVSEAIVIVDLVDSTKITNRHGWRTVGRPMLRDLRECIKRVCSDSGLCCRKFTGDGYMLTFRKEDSELAVVQALQAMINTCHEIEKLKEKLPKQRWIRLRFALHYGEVDPVDNDREGPEVSYTFRLEGVKKESLEAEEAPYIMINLETFPIDNYAVLSEEVVEILKEREVEYSWEPIGAVRLRGFRGRHELLLLRNLSAIDS